MLVGIKDSFKLFGVSVICCCAALVCTMFLNFAIDLKSIGDIISTLDAQVLYDAQLMTSRVVIAVTGLCLLLTSAVTMLFHVKHFIDRHKKDLGILKALGHSDIKIARNFAAFGVSVFVGCILGFGLAYAVMPRFYALQNKDAIMPDIPLVFHGEVLVYFVILPTLAFSTIAVLYACYKLKQPVLSLLKEAAAEGGKKHISADKDETPFLKGLSLSVLKGKKVLAFFICFSSFCFSALIQMGASMDELSSEMMGAMMIIIGVVLAVTTLILAIVTVVNSNRQTIAVMRAFGYTDMQCINSVLGIYRPFAYVGFALGTVYQFGLLKVMVAIVFKDIAGVPEYSFDFAVMAITLAVFIVAYEGLTLLCAKGIKRITLRQIMSE